MALKSLNQIVQRVKSLALSHKQVNHFFYGDLPEFDARMDITYVGVFLESQPGTVDRAAKLQRFNFRLYALDLVNVSEDTKENETEVLSDMAQVVSDLISLMLQPAYQFDWDVSDSNTVQLVTETLGDMVAGAVVDFSISVPFFADACEVPADEIVVPTDFDMARTKLYSYDADGSETDSFPVPFLSGKAIIGAFRAGQFKRPVAVLPTTSDRMQVGTTDMGEGKGILGSGTVNLQTGDALVPGEELNFLYYA